MFLYGLLAWGLATGARAAEPAPPVVPVGKIVQLDRVASQYVAPHDIDVWLPPDYPKQAPYAVLYMFDGQNLFGEREPGKMQSWRAAATAAQLIAAGKTRPFIIVGIANAQSLRMSEYFPQKPWEALTPAQRRTLFAQQLGTFQILPVAPYSDAFLKFVTQELKPAIDRRYAVDARPAATFAMGSSMGGLISLYAVHEYPQVFGGAAGLSTHWVGLHVANSALPLAAFNYLQAHLLAPGTHRMYMDHGSTELDALYAPYQSFINQIVRDRGYTEAQAMLRVFEGKGHNERDWAERVALPLLFLMGPR